MDNFKVIYKILKFLETEMDSDTHDKEPISPDSLGISENRWIALMLMLAQAGYVSGIEAKLYIDDSLKVTKNEPKITLKGLEYLVENGILKQILKAAKGIKELIPGV